MRAPSDCSALFMLKKTLPILFILLLALAWRVYRLPAVPPGLTHDEANHGREAIEILDGILRYYFPLNYGSEPLYSYAVAGSMALFGEGLFALRLVNVFFGLLAIAATYAWGKLAFGRITALVAAALMAVSFWPLASSREALRAGMLPFFMVVAVWIFWRLVFPAWPALSAPPATHGRGRPAIWIAGFALAVVATLHIYLAARVTWLLFPAFLIYLALAHRPVFRRAWLPVSSGLLLAGLLVVPMFVYLAGNPQAQTRLSMLGRTLEQVRAGAWGPLVQNATAALLAFVWPGYGDQFLAYNIPGRPVFDLLTAAFFIAGLLACLWRWKRPAYAFLLLWFVTGIIPSLVTGPTANTTRNLAALPAVYLLPAVGFVTATHLATRRLRRRALIVVGGAAIWIMIAGLVSGRDYFLRWAESAAVRGAYQHTLVEELSYLSAAGLEDAAVVMSTVYPGAAHDASIAMVLAGPGAERLRWVDARRALVLPASSQSFALVPASTPPHGAFRPYLQALETRTLRAGDLDPAFTAYRLEAGEALEGFPPRGLAQYGGAVTLRQALWLTGSPAPGDIAELLTVWEVNDPARVGPPHPPADATDAAFFAHLLDQDGAIITQHDGLDAPSWAWRAGDIILQVHPLQLPPNLAQTTLPVAVGVYDRQTGERLAVYDQNGAVTGTTFMVDPLRVAQTSEQADNQGHGET